MTRDTDLIRRGDAIKAVTDADRDCRGAHGARENIAALRAAPPVGARVTGWQPIETAPYGVPVRVKLGRGTTIVAVLRNNAATTEDGNDCDQWQAHFEGEHPECWTDGACWQSNADNVMSLQPRAWTALLPAGEGE